MLPHADAGEEEAIPPMASWICEEVREGCEEEEMEWRDAPESPGWG